MILDLMPIGLLIHQEMGILFANQAAADFFGSTQDALVGQHIFDYLTQEDLAKTKELFAAVFSSEVAKQVSEVSIYNKAIGRRFYRLTSARLPWEGTPACQILVQDITTEKKKDKQLKNMLATDALTGAQNRRSFIDYASRVANYDRPQPCGMIFMDIDHFKTVNDTYGHDVGDIVLRKIVFRAEHILARHIFDAANDDQMPPMLARLGGEEFAILVPGGDENQSIRLAEELRAAIADSPIETYKRDIPVTASFGVVTCHSGDTSLDHAMRKADKALYVAKDGGRNQVVAHSNIVAAEISDTAFVARQKVR